MFENIISPKIFFPWCDSVGLFKPSSRNLIYKSNPSSKPVMGDKAKDPTKIAVFCSIFEKQILYIFFFFHLFYSQMHNNRSFIHMLYSYCHHTHQKSKKEIKNLTYTVQWTCRDTGKSQFFCINSKVLKTAAV